MTAMVGARALMRKVELGQYSRLFVTAQVTGWLRALPSDGR